MGGLPLGVRVELGKSSKRAEWRTETARWAGPSGGTECGGIGGGLIPELSTHPLRLLMTQAVREPRKAVTVLFALAKGHWCKFSCRLRGVRFECGRNLRVFGTLSIKGPGLVRFGDDVAVDMTVTPWTYESSAVIDIGDGTYLNGTQFGCARSIVVGPRCILATASIMDTNFHSIDITRHEPGADVKIAPVRIGSNVWVAARTGILPGTMIGDNSVVGFGSVCSGEYPANALISSARATVVRQLK
jgi:acetyltransferase-like isoleucine patch superfamily enzyme